jgi:hypothetical protein
MLHALLLLTAVIHVSQVAAQPATSSTQACSQHFCKPATATVADFKSEAGCKSSECCKSETGCKSAADCQSETDRKTEACYTSEADCKSYECCPQSTAAKCGDCKRIAARSTTVGGEMPITDRLQIEAEELGLATGATQQIRVRIRVLEVPKSQLCQLADKDCTSCTQNSASAAANANKADKCKATRTLALWVLDESQSIEPVLEQLSGKILAEPSINTLSGEPASFHVGGVLPVPASADSSGSVDYLKFGTEVDLLAVALSNNNIRLNARIAVSEPDYTRTVSIRGSDVPVVNKRLVDTSFELASGTSGVVSFAAAQNPTPEEKECRGCTAKNEQEEVQLLFVVTPELIPTTRTARR